MSGNKSIEQIEDSLDFCKDISFYESTQTPLQFDQENYPKLKEYLHWSKQTESSIHSDYVQFESILNQIDYSSRASEDDYILNCTPGKDSVATLEVASALDTDEMLEVVEPGFMKALFGELWRLLICVLVAFSLVLIITNFVASHTKVIGISMQNTLHDGDYLIINRLTYQFSDPKRSDIVVFKHSKDNYYIKRVIGLPGERIQIREGQIYINGSLLEESINSELIEDSGVAKQEITLGNDEYFVLGDNRNSSTDSRFEAVGFIKRDNIIGKILVRIFPFDDFGTID